jgi:hypothetical protein
MRKFRFLMLEALKSAPHLNNSDDKLNVWMHVLTRDHLFVKILVVHKC